MKKERAIDWVSFALIEIFRVSQESQIILIKDSDKPNPPLWKLVGGQRKHTVDHGPERTLRREVFDEIGLKIKSREIKERFIEKVKESKGDGSHFFYVYHIKLVEHDRETRERLSLLEAKNEVMELEVFSISEVKRKIKEFLLVNDHAEALTEWLQKEGYGNY
ncbi:MAG: NUDIX hydrolase [Candidatus Paceibacterota bacterium]